MTIKKLTLTLSLALTVAACALTACAVTEHIHSYSTKWSHNDSQHWHNATCVHLSEKTDVEDHVFDGGVETFATYESEGYLTYTCSVCSYQKTEQTSPKLMHEYASDLTHENGDTHWYACVDEGYEHLKYGEEKHTLIETDYNESTGYATYTCKCLFTRQYLRCNVMQAPTIEGGVYVGQTLSQIPLLGGQSTVEGEFSWTNSSQVVTESGNYAITFTPYDSQFAPVASEVYIAVEQLSVTVTVGENGTANKSGKIDVNYGQNLSLVFLPNSGYAVESITVNGESIAPSNSYILENITYSYEIEVAFAKSIEENLPFTLTYVSGTQNAYTYQNGVLTFIEISEQSVYAISGSLDGNIVIDVGENYKFDLELTGFTLTSSAVNPITVLSGDEVSLTAKNGTQNYIYDTRSAIDTTDETLYSAAIYSLVDLEICGKGSLALNSDNNNGVHTKDDLQVKNLTLNVTCKDNALKGNDGVEITNAATTLIATQGDCIKTTNSHVNETTLNQKGTVYIAGGTHNLYAACDGIDAAYNVLIEGDTTALNIYTDKYSQYSEEVTATSESTYYLRYSSTAYKYSVKYYNNDEDYLWVNVSDSYKTVSSSGGRPGQNSTYYYYTFAKKSEYSKLAVYMYSSSQTQGQDSSYYACTEYKTINSSYDTVALSYRSGTLSLSWTNYTTASTGGMGGMQEGNSDKGTYSTKGIKAANEITVNAGNINIRAYDDAVHANNDVALENGATPLGNVTVNGGTVTAYSNDDGLHADGTLLVTNGTVCVINAYEGLEGAFITVMGGNVSAVSSDDGFNATSTTGAAITISGGEVYVYATGDGLDSNGTTSKGAIAFSGGNTVVICNSNGNAAIDSDGGYSHTGGRVLAIMSSGGMTSETTNGNATGRTTKSSLSLSNGGYITVTVSGESVVTVKMPCSLTAFAVYLGSSSATIAAASTITSTLNTSGVCWY